MRKLIYAVGAAVVLVVTFSLGMRVGSQPRMAATTDGFVSKVEVVEANTMMSPFDLMVKHGKTLQTDKWSDPF